MPESSGSARSAETAPLRPRHVRTLALAGAVVGVVVLPIAAAQATPSQNHDTQAAAGAGAGQGQGQASASPSSTASPGAGAQALTPEFCGVVRAATMAGGTVHVQACVVQADDSASARVYVANGTTKDQFVAVNLTRADGSVIQVQCTITAGDASGLCETSPTSIGAGSGAFNAIAELATPGAPLSAGVVHVESGLVAPAAQVAQPDSTTAQ